MAFLFERLGWLKSFYQKSGAPSKFVVFLANFMVGKSVMLYVFARLCLMVLVFRSLFFLEPHTFVTTWAREVPNVQ
jgi:hypothetical protein